MTIAKDLICFAMFLCLFAVLLLFIELQHELRSSIVEHNVTITAQVKVIESDLILLREQNHKISGLQIEIIDLQELLMVLQKHNQILSENLKIEKEISASLYRDYKDIQSKIKQLEEKKNAC